MRNGEEQYYTVAREENAYMADGCLHIVCRNDSALIEDALYEQQWSGSHGYRADTIIPITSASVVTKGKFAFTYGRVEVRAKLPVPSNSSEKTSLVKRSGIATAFNVPSLSHSKLHCVPSSDFSNKALSADKA